MKAITVHLNIHCPGKFAQNHQSTCAVSSNCDTSGYHFECTYVHTFANHPKQYDFYSIHPRIHTDNYFFTILISLSSSLHTTTRIHTQHTACGSISAVFMDWKSSAKVNKPQKFGSGSCVMAKHEYPPT